MMGPISDVCQHTTDYSKHFVLLFRAELQIKISGFKHPFNGFRKQKDNRNHTSPLTYSDVSKVNGSNPFYDGGIGRKKEIVPLYLMSHTYHSRRELELP